MNRRDFIIASGSAVLTTSLGLSQSQQPAVGVSFELSEIPNEKPENVDTLIVGFDKLEVTPKYSDMSGDMTVKASLDMGKHGMDESGMSNMSVENGQTRKLSDSMNPMIVDDIDADSIIYGIVEIDVEHSDATDSYYQRFNIIGSETPNSVVYNFDDGTFGSDWTTSVSSNGSNSWVREESGQLQIRAQSGSSNECGTNYAETSEIGYFDGSISISYDWESNASGWYESARTTVYEDGVEIWSDSNNPGKNGSKSGSTTKELTVDGDIVIRFSVEPSSSCTNSDHNWTEYNIDNLQVDYL